MYCISSSKWSWRNVDVHLKDLSWEVTPSVFRGGAVKYMEGFVKMEGSDISECPVCSKMFPLSSITNHVNACLNTSTQESKPTQSVGKRKSNTSNTISAWNFLTSTSITNTKSAMPNKKIKINDDSSKSSPNSKSTNEQISNECCLIKVDAPVNENTGSKTKSLLNDTNLMQSNKDVDNLPKKALSFSRADLIPLAERMRPKTLDNYVGQDSAVGEKSLLHSLLKSQQIPSMILWGPPGCGKVIYF